MTTADRIYVLDGGSVVEHGTHSELLALDGTYARMFNLQAAQYLDQTEAGDGSAQELALAEVGEEGLEVGPGELGLDVVHLEDGVDHGVEGDATHQ